MSDDDAVLYQYLSEQGCSPQEIASVLARLEEHDSRTIRESVFDSIESGSFNLDEIIQEVTQKSGQPLEQTP